MAACGGHNPRPVKPLAAMAMPPGGPAPCVTVTAHPVPPITYPESLPVS